MRLRRTPRLTELLNNAMTLPWLVVVTASIVAAVTDLRSRRIPNVLTFPLWIAGITCGFLGLAANGSGLSSLAASILCAAPFVVLFLFARGGAGDAKMMAMIGAWLGVEAGLFTLIMVLVCGASAAVFISFVRRESRDALANIAMLTSSTAALATGRISAADFRAITPPTASMHRFPYGVAIAAGVLLASILFAPVSNAVRTTLGGVL